METMEMDKLSVPEIEFYLEMIEQDREVYDFVTINGGVDKCLRLMRERLEAKRKEQEKPMISTSGLQFELIPCECFPIGEELDEMLEGIVASQGFRLANFEELTSFQLEYPELSQEYHILGASSIVDGKKCVSSLRNKEVEQLDMEIADRLRLHGRRCLGVKEVQPKS